MKGVASQNQRLLPSCVTLCIMNIKTTTTLLYCLYIRPTITAINMYIASDVYYSAQTLCMICYGRSVLVHSKNA